MIRSLIALPLLLCLGVANAATPDTLQPASTLGEHRALSERLQQTDTRRMQQELDKANLAAPIPAERAHRFGFDPGQDKAFYRTEEGRQVAESIMSYQTPSGGWSKRTRMGHELRPLGGAFGVEAKYIPTFDNDATSTQLWQMASAYHATDDERFADAANRALQLILLAQYPNGGWPQSFPLRGGYHDAITYNDEVVPNLLSIVAATANNHPKLDFLTPELRQLARDSLDRGLAAVVATQIVIDGKATIWGGQHHAQTLQPIAARAYEPAALTTSESAELMVVLMALEAPPESIKSAIVAAHSWFSRHRIDGYQWQRGDAGYNELVADDNAGPLWARFYSLEKQRPLFSDRDGSIYASVDEVSTERRLGYGWYTDKPSVILDNFTAWQQKHMPETHIP